MTKIPLVLLPGLLCDQQVWSHQRQHLSQKADIIIPNLNHAATPQAMVNAVLTIAPPYFALAGHSMGGWVALEVFKHSPNRVLGLALLNTTAQPDSIEKQAARRTMIQQAEKKDYPPIIDRLMKSFIYNTRMADEMKSMLERNQHALISQEKAMIQREDCIAILETITCPTLIVHSEYDAIFHYPDSQLLAEKIKHACFSIIKNCGHMSPIESPQEVTQLMTLWLDKIQPHL